MMWLPVLVGTLACLANGQQQQNTLTGIPTPTGTTTSSTTAYAGGVSLSSVSYSYTYTYTTPTTMWHAPTFATPTPLPLCTESICPSDNGSRCVDSEGVVYGVLCNTLFSGIVITNSGKFLAKDKRSYTGTFEGCTAFCNTYNDTICVGVTYQGGECLAYDVITGTFPNPAGGFSGLRLSD